MAFAPERHGVSLKDFSRAVAAHHRLTFAPDGKPGASERHHQSRMGMSETPVILSPR
jgi:hypothetical protein